MSNMLPSLVPALQETVDNMNSATTTTEAMGKSFSFNFDTGDFIVKDGKLVELEGLEALKVWIEKILRTEKNGFEIYSSYGVAVQDLLNKGYHMGFIQSEIMREITEALTTNTDINSVTDFAFTTTESGLNVAFTVNSKYGTTESEVTI